MSAQRLILRIPQVLGEADSEWAETSDPTNSVPRLGDTIWVQFSGGDVTKPIYIANGMTALNVLINRKITYSADAPGATPNSVGDAWWQQNTAGEIIGQWQGLGGTAWASRQLSHEAIASINADTITSGTLTGRTVQTAAEDSVGIKMTTAGLKAYSPSGAQTFYLDAVTGDSTFSGDTIIGGNAVITGTLSLPAGIVDNDALASPVKPQYIFASGTGFALATTDAAVASSTITVPAGFTSAVVSVVGRVYATNPNAGYDYLITVSKIDGTGCANLPLLVGGSGGSGIVVAPYSRVLTGLTGGGTFVVEVRAYANTAAWAANAQNTAELSGTILWFR